MDEPDPIVQSAQDYARRGFSVIPIGRVKKPTWWRWKGAMLKAAAADEIPGWFGRQRGLEGVGIVLGTVSGDLYVRDFDVAESYHAWAAAHPDLARQLPTVQTARGFHVYSRCKDVRTTPLGDGELRGEKHYVIAPPSRHASGTIYTWMVPLPEGDIPEVEPSVAGLDKSWLAGADHATERTERTDETERTENTEKQRHGEIRDTDDTEDMEDTEEIEAVFRASIRESWKLIDDAIQRTLPKQPATRNRHIFKFARALKAIPQLRELPVEHIKLLREVVRDWWTRALPNITTKDFGATWGEFVQGWPKVRFPEGEGVLCDALRLARSSTPPAWSADYGREQQLLAALCRELQRKFGADAPFYLSCQMAASCVGVDASTAHRYFAALVADGAIVEIRKGTMGKATRWKYIAEDLHK